MDRIYNHQIANIADYDRIVQTFFHDIEDQVRMKADPFFKEKVMPDHENFADPRR